MDVKNKNGKFIQALCLLLLALCVQGQAGKNKKARGRGKAKKERLARSRLHVAVSVGDLKLVRQLLQEGAPVDALSNFKSISGDSAALHIAAVYGNTDMVDLLLKYNASINVRTSKGATPLMFAAERGNANMIDKLLRAGADFDVQDAVGITPLQTASSSGHLAAVDRLLEAGSDCNVGEGTSVGTSLHLASSEGHLGVVNRLLEAGADANAGAHNGETPLLMASAGGRLKIVKRLLEAKADFHLKGGPLQAMPLHAASSGGHLGIVELLLRAGADVNAEAEEKSALMYALDQGHQSVVEAIIRIKPEAISFKNSKDITPLHYASAGGSLETLKLLFQAYTALGNDTQSVSELLCHALNDAVCHSKPEQALQKVKYLLAAGVDANERAHSKTHKPSVLHYAAASGLTEIIKELLRYGARIDVKRTDGLTALDEALQNRQRGVIRMLLDQAAAALTLEEAQILRRRGFADQIDLHIDRREKAKKALFDALATSSIKAVSSLLSLGVDINQQNEQGQTILMLAAQMGSRELVELLVSYDNWALLVWDDEERNALDYARASNHTEIIAYLKKQEEKLRELIRTSVDVHDNLIRTPQGKLFSPDAFMQEVIKEWRKKLCGVRGLEDGIEVRKAVAQMHEEVSASPENILGAISRSDLVGLRQCLKSEIDPLYKNEHGNTALIAAVKKAAKAKESASQRIVRELLTRDEIRGAVNEPGSKGVTALMAAIADAEMVGFLLDGCKQNLKLDCVDEHGQTVFAHAAHSALPRVMRTLLAFAKENVEPNDLWDALTKRDQKGNTATMIAARSGKHENAELLLQAIESLAALNDDRGQHVSEQKEWVKQYRHSHPDAMSSIEFDEDDQKEEPVELQQAHKEGIDLLRAGSWQQFNESLRAHEHVPSWIRDQVVVGGQNTTVLHLALEATDSPSQKFFKGLLSVTGDRVVNLTDDRGRQPLDLAIATGKRGLIKALLAHKAQVQARHITDVAAIVATIQNQADQKHWQALQDAMQRKIDAVAVTKPTEYATKEAVATEKQSDKQKQLLAKIADKSAAFRNGWVKELLSTGFDVNEKLEQQMTLLMRAADAGSLEAVNVLLKAGANVNAKDAHGDTPFAYASRAAHTALANRLCVAMAEQGFKKKPSALGHIMQRHACKAPKSLKSRGMNVKDRPFFIEEMRTIRDNGKTMRKKCKAHQFPESWNKQKIQKAIGAVLSSPQQVVDNHAEIDDSGTVVRGTLAVEGVVHGLNMRVVVSNAREAARWCVFTAYPLLSRA